jgi:NADP-dependent 3-hydroxy acid dehydrogenase YdfG
MMDDARQGPVCLITGGGSGVGAATAIAFGRLGGRVVLVDRNPDATAGVIAKVTEAGGQCSAVALDVRDADALEDAVAAAVRQHGRLDVVVAAAGIADQSAVATGDPARWKDVIDTNLLGTLLTARAGVSIMLTQSSGHIFIVSSVSGRESYVGEPAYIASKWGQVGFAHALRQEVMAAGIRVTVIEPGLINTPLVSANPNVAHLLDLIDPLQPEDVANAIVYAYEQPPYVVLSELTLRPLRQQLPDLGAPTPPRHEAP